MGSPPNTSNAVGRIRSITSPRGDSYSGRNRFTEAAPVQLGTKITTRSSKIPMNRLCNNFQMPNILNGKPDFEELERLLSEYHIRDFTYPDDSLPGATGFLTLLSRTFEGGFLCGHPEAWFDATLMLDCNLLRDESRSDAGREILERREATKQSSILPGAVLPSWSWIS